MQLKVIKFSTFSQKNRKEKARILAEFLLFLFLPTTSLLCNYKLKLIILIKCKLR